MLISADYFCLCQGHYHQRPCVSLDALEWWQSQMMPSLIIRGRIYSHPLKECGATFRKCASQRSGTGPTLTLCGDGRADTPGHRAKFGTYTMLDLNVMMVVNVQMIQVEIFVWLITPHGKNTTAQAV